MTHRNVTYPHRVGVMASVMWETRLVDVSWQELECRVPERTVHDTNLSRILTRICPGWAIICELV